MRQGETGRSLFVVHQGEVVVRLEPDGREVARTQPGGVFGEMSLLTGDPRTATVAAARDSVVLEIDAEALREVVLSRPDAVDAISRLVVERRAGLDAAQAAARDDAGLTAQSAVLLDRMRRVLAPVAAWSPAMKDSHEQRLERPAVTATGRSRRPGRPSARGAAATMGAVVDPGASEAPDSSAGSQASRAEDPAAEAELRRAFHAAGPGDAAGPAAPGRGDARPDAGHAGRGDPGASQGAGARGRPPAGASSTAWRATSSTITCAA